MGSITTWIEHQSCWGLVEQIGGEASQALYLSGEQFICPHDVTYSVAQVVVSCGVYSLPRPELRWQCTHVA